MSSNEPMPLLRVNCFEVLIADRNVGFAEVGGITSETDLSERSDRSNHRFAPLILRRALTTSTDLFEWRRGYVSGKDDRRDVTIRQLAVPGGEVVNAWKLVRAWPCRWSGPAFNAMRNEAACEELELRFDDVVWLAPGR